MKWAHNEEITVFQQFMKFMNNHSLLMLTSQMEKKVDL